MKLKKIKLINYRNFIKKEFIFDKTNIILAPNGSGKTNLLEAIYLLAAGKSFRTSQNQSLVKKNQNFARIEANIESENKNTKIEFVIDLKNFKHKKIKIDSASKPIFEIIGKLKSVYFSPESLEIILGSPSERRRFIDITISQTDIKYAKNLAELLQIIKNRNILLKKIQENQANFQELDFWNIKLADLSAKIIEKRFVLISELNTKISKYYDELSESEDVLSLDYKSQVQNFKNRQIIKKQIEEKIITRKEPEIFFGKTMVGPQREDLLFKLNNQEMSQIASRGEIRTALIALKLAEMDYVKNAADGESPILLLDDPFSELDKKRTAQLFIKLKELNQIFITSANQEKIQNQIKGKINIIKLNEFR